MSKQFMQFEVGKPLNIRLVNPLVKPIFKGLPIKERGSCGFCKKCTNPAFNKDQKKDTPI